MIQTETRPKIATRVITDNSDQALIIKYDGERFALIERDKVMPDMPVNKIIMLNPREAKEISDFIEQQANNVND